MQNLLRCSQIEELVNYLKKFKCGNTYDLARINFLLDNGYMDHEVKQWINWYTMVYCKDKSPCEPNTVINCEFLIEEVIDQTCSISLPIKIEEF